MGICQGIDGGQCFAGGGDVETRVAWVGKESTVLRQEGGHGSLLDAGKYGDVQARWKLPAIRAGARLSCADTYDGIVSIQAK